MSILDYILGNEDKKLINKLTPLVNKILLLEEELKSLSDEELKNKSLNLKTQIQSVVFEDKEKEKLEREKELDKNIHLAFALCREAARRTLGMMHYKVQLLGGLIIHRGNLAEMRTGEGKTLVATLPSYANALLGYGVHIVTVNDYLARRDSVWMGQIYEALGMSVGVINNKISYLYSANAISQNPVTEEERVNNLENLVLDAERDKEGEYKVEYDYLKEVSKREAYLADITYGTNSEFGFDYLRDHLIYSKNNLSQRSPLEGGHYFAIVDEADSILIDESRTPLIISNSSHDSENLYRVFADIARQMNKDIHYTVDEKQRAVQINDEGITLAEKALKIPSLYTSDNVALIHHLEIAIKAKALFNKEKEYVVRDGEVIIVDEFTGRMQPGRRWSDGIHQAVEAKEGVMVQKESRTVASITYQNYFRFYKRLSGMTGTGKTSQEEFVKVYNLPVITVPTHNDIKRIDHKDIILQTRISKMKVLAQKVKELHTKGQPVLIGTISIENNEVVSTFLTNVGVPHNVLNAKNHEREGEIIAGAGKRGAVTIATNMAGRGVDIKLGGPNATVAEHDEIEALGGLYVIGTERHEARRIDNQLRGRSGRQGDNGETQFYISLEDDLIRVFGGDKLKVMMDKMGLPQDIPIESRMVSKAIENAQERIEGYHFDARKHTLDYDNVLNKQRSAVYQKRNTLLFADNFNIDKIIEEIVEDKDLSIKQNNLNLISTKKEKYKEEFYTITRQSLMQIYDVAWMDHLEYMDNLRQNVNLRAYGQRDPLVEYKRDALRMFKSLESRVKQEYLSFISHMDNIFITMQAEEIKKVKDAVGDISRNDPCPCGSGKKVKKCDCQEYKFLR